MILFGADLDSHLDIGIRIIALISNIRGDVPWQRYSLSE